MANVQSTATDALDIAGYRQASQCGTRTERRLAYALDAASYRYAGEAMAITERIRADACYAVWYY